MLESVSKLSLIAFPVKTGIFKEVILKDSRLSGKRSFGYFQSFETDS